MIRIAFVVLFISFVISSFSQQRYTSKVVEHISVETDIIYSTADSWDLTGTGTYNPRPIKMDIYTPIEDNFDKQPTIICIFGGAFLAGNKERPDIAAWCDSLAHYGYTAVAINYRLGFNPVVGSGGIGPAAGMKRAAYRAMQDCNAAIDFLSENCDLYRIDTTQMFLLGNSAGAITAINTVFLSNDERYPETYDVGIGNNNVDLGDLNSTSKYPNHTSRPAGVVGLWGATMDFSWLDEGEQVPMIFFHGGEDEIIPIDEGYAFNFGNNNNVNVYLYGSRKIHEYFVDNNWEDSLHYYIDQPHAFYSCGDIDPISFEREFFPCEYWEPVFYETINWLCAHNTHCENSNIDIYKHTVDFTVYPNPADNFIDIDFSGSTYLHSKLNIYNVIGKLCFSQRIVSKSTHIDLRAFKKGLYFIEAINIEGSKSVKFTIE